MSVVPRHPLFLIGCLVAASFAATSCEVLDQLDQASQEQSQVVPEGDPTQVLTLVNQARAAGHNCGSEGSFGAAPALGWNDKLGRAATRHAGDMASHDFMSHTGSDGSTAAERISDEGYDWSAIGENVAAGQASPQEVVSDWLSSPGHCANIMDPNFVHMGIARAQGGTYGVYWAQEFARPR